LQAAAAMTTKQFLPKGILIPIGGAEDKKDNKEILQRIVEETKKRKATVCVITLATNLANEVASDYRTAFKDLGAGMSVIHFHQRREADTTSNLSMIKKADAIFFCGGNQLKLSSLLGGTKLLALIRKRYFKHERFVIAGTSAGAAAMSETMIVSGSSQDSLIRGELELTKGLGFIASVFIDTHFTQRGRFGRLIQTVACNPGVMGLGLGEDTAVIIYAGHLMEVVGSGLVVIVDGQEITYTDLTEVDSGQPITVENLKMHVLGKNQRFLLTERRLQWPDKK